MFKETCAIASTSLPHLYSFIKAVVPKLVSQNPPGEPEADTLKGNGEEMTVATEL